ncbi:mannose-1-phosphate guanylyltransferase/mannose-6-phosphate isomerase [Hippea alviniae]|uniref:mannose-1-phosphate guanylyltransferase/mannose-6-phosphate isomerase n=1 Tax=Hippea alviniae TaxID=1279027 RepID=UPI0003B7A01F|nr:mannose-1-phosphate guanylyltransferase/mannose-6-phosphate isomerase [Hippea alviniae]
MKNLILCGGSGTRLWPLSRKLMPKQFLKLFNGKSLFQLTIERNIELCDSFIISVNEEQYFLVLDQIEELTIHDSQITAYDSLLTTHSLQFLLETEAKNTAPAIAFASLSVDEDEILFITPADHLIKNSDKYKEAVLKAKELALKGYLVTFGITPTEPNTGYGYIETEDSGNGNHVLSVEKFHEKPDLKTAKQYLELNASHSTPITYLWNSGMFMFKAGVYLEELKRYAPEVYEESLKSFENRQKINDNQIRIKDMKNIPSISIDYAVMEKSKKIKVIKSEFYWSDVGSFDSLVREMAVSNDNENNKAEEIEIDSKNNFYFSDRDKLIATIGLEDFIVIDTNDALLIAKKGQTQQVKEIVNQLKETHNSLLTTHSIVHRPWGTYEVLVEDKGYKIKRIIVKPGKRLSLQKHFHRNEHWIVVSGTAEVTVGNKTFLLRPNESTYIKMGELHRLANPGKIPVILIEAQVGEYVEENDIERVEDDYRRNQQ